MQSKLEYLRTPLPGISAGVWMSSVGGKGSDDRPHQLLSSRARRHQIALTRGLCRLRTSRHRRARPDPSLRPRSTPAQLGPPRPPRVLTHPRGRSQRSPPLPQSRQSRQGPRPPNLTVPRPRLRPEWIRYPPLPRLPILTHSATSRVTSTANIASLTSSRVGSVARPPACSSGHDL